MSVAAKEWTIFVVLLIGFALIGSAGGATGVWLFIGSALVIWVFWRGRKL